MPRSNAPIPHHHRDTIPVDEEPAPPKRQRLRTNPPGAVHDPTPQPGHDEGSPPHEEHLEGLPPRTPSPPLGRGQSPSPPPVPHRSRREKRVPKKPGNVYGDHHPVEILKDPSGKKGGQKVHGPLPPARENQPSPSRLNPDPPHTGGKPLFTHQVCVEFIVGSCQNCVLTPFPIASGPDPYVSFSMFSLEPRSTVSVCFRSGLST